MFDKQQLIPMACDHGAFEMKEFLKDKLKKLGYKIKDMGTNSSISGWHKTVDLPIA